MGLLCHSNFHSMKRFPFARKICEIELRIKKKLSYPGHYSFFWGYFGRKIVQELYLGDRELIFNASKNNYEPLLTFHTHTLFDGLHEVSSILLDFTLLMSELARNSVHKDMTFHNSKILRTHLLLFSYRQFIYF